MIWVDCRGVPGGMDVVWPDIERWWVFLFGLMRYYGGAD